MLSGLMPLISDNVLAIIVLREIILIEIFFQTVDTVAARIVDLIIFVDRKGYDCLFQLLAMKNTYLRDSLGQESGFVDTDGISVFFRNDGCC